MKAESGNTFSIWVDTFTVPKFESLKKNADVEVCVVGAGITGLTCAYLLAREGKKVIVVDDGSIAGGESARTTAHITNVIDDRYSEIERLHGEEGAQLAAESQTEAINSIERIVQEEKIDCDFKRVPGYLFFLPDDSADLLQQEYDACLRAGIDVEIAAQDEIKIFNTYPCLRFPQQGQFHMLKYLSGLAEAFIKKGGEIYTHTHVDSIEDGAPVKLKTRSKHTITAGDVVVATNSPISDYLAIHTKQAAYRTYVIGVEIPKDSIEEALYWDNDSPYHYIRTFKEAENDILIIGGEDHKTGQDENTEEHFKNLYEWAKIHFDNLGKIKYNWSGQVLEPVDGLSYIGKDPENSEHVYIATGDSGMGITHGTYSGLLLTDMIMGRENHWAKLYDPKRITLRAAPEFIKEGVNTAFQFTDFVTPGDVADIKDIKPDEGAVIRDGLTKIAVYKNSDGEVYKFSALCPHLKCILQWNSLEKSWDCPCHGSRFDAKGNVINGPALGNMKKL